MSDRDDSASEISRLQKVIDAHSRALTAWLFYAEACAEGLPQEGLDRRLDNALELTRSLPTVPKAR